MGDAPATKNPRIRAGLQTLGPPFAKSSLLSLSLSTFGDILDLMTP
jgi:hypothetical protein